MGTGKPGRYLNTYGSKNKMSDFALVHTSEGVFTKPQKKGDKLRLVSGGHSQAGISLLEKYNIEYNVLVTYANGVRAGNIPNHKRKYKQTGLMQTWFPANWTNKMIRKAAEHIAALNCNKHVPDGKTMYGKYKGVYIGVKRTNGCISTAFPDNMQPSKIKESK